MNVHVTGPTAGDAARVKLIRSVYMKGRDALLVEMLTTARRCGLDARVVDSIARAPGEQVPFEQLVERVMPALVRHAGRRADELANASAEVERSGLEPTMTTAAERRLRWMASLTQIADLGARPRPPAAGDVITALADAAAAQAGAAGGDRGAE
jgi:3-hydroxyisobutyrate dehydrogenase-like beta-hydroxyacid dehydrogenase